MSEGAVLTRADAPRLSALLPAEVWRHRDVLIPDGMRIEVGPCHRRYPQPLFFRRATEQFAGAARLDDAGNLVGYTAGLPFPPEAIDPASGDAGARWAWNLEQRYRGAGPSGSFQITDLPGAIGEIETYRGSWFQLQTAQRADLAATRYRTDENEPRRVDRGRALLRARPRAASRLAAGAPARGRAAVRAARRPVRVHARPRQAAPRRERVDRWAVHAALSRRGRRPRRVALRARNRPRSRRRDGAGRGSRGSP